MIKTILVGATGTERDAPTLAAALAIARPFAAHLDVLHVRLDPVAVTVAMSADTATTGVMTPGLIDQLEADAKAGEARAHDAFMRFCAGAGLAERAAPGGRSGRTPSVAWHVESGDEGRWMAAYGLAADLIVASRGAHDDPAARATLETLLLETGRPLLIPAGGAAMPAAFERIAIAWKPVPQAARAVASALPLLTRAKTVLVLTVEERGRGEPEAEAGRLVRHLAWHGVSAKRARVKSGTAGGAAALLRSAARRADLLVMGGYGHSRLREWVFGGFTQQVLVAAPLPVLLAH